MVSADLRNEVKVNITFGAAHSSTSISAALGFTMARELGQPVGDTIAVIGMVLSQQAWPVKR